jgi:hypothetical protein
VLDLRIAPIDDGPASLDTADLLGGIVDDARDLVSAHAGEIRDALGRDVSVLRDAILVGLAAAAAAIVAAIAVAAAITGTLIWVGVPWLIALWSVAAVTAAIAVAITRRRAGPLGAHTASALAGDAAPEGPS